MLKHKINNLFVTLVTVLIVTISLLESPILARADETPTESWDISPVVSTSRLQAKWYSTKHLDIVGFGDSAVYNNLSMNSTVHEAHCNAPWLSYVANMETVNIQAGKGIGGYNFYENTGVKTVNINAAITTIGESSFRDCTALTGVNFSAACKASMESIGDKAFKGDSLLKSLIIKDMTSLTSIGTEAFADTGITMLIVPNNVTSIGEDAFKGIKLVYYAGTASDTKGNNWGAEVVRDRQKAGDNITWTVSSQTLTFSGTGPMYDWNIITGKELLTCAPWHGSKAVISKIVIGEGITTIGDYALYDLYNSPISMPGTITTIGKYAFYKSKFNTIAIPESVVTIKEGAFANTSFSTLSVPCSVTAIGDNAFTGISEVLYSGKATDSLSNRWGATSINENPVHKEVSANNAVAPTCTADGKLSDTKCAFCNKTLSVGAVVPKGHKEVSANNAVAPTCLKEGKKSDTKCERCGITLKVGEAIPVIAHSGILVNVKTATYFEAGYTGDTVCQNCNTTLATGQSIAQLKLKGTSISKIKSTKVGSLSLEWKKLKEASGYEIQYSTDKKFKSGVKTVKVSKNSTLTKTVSKLKSGKKYYVRIRTVKTGKVDGKKKTVTSSWSKVKNIKVK